MKKNPLLMIGGLAMCSHEYEPIVKQLKLHGFEVLRFDNPCVGSGPRGLKTLSIQSQADHQWSEIKKVLGADAKAVDIFGLSMGGMIAAEMAAAEPHKVGRLIVAATSPNIVPELEAFSDVLSDRFLNIKTAEELRQAVDIAFGRTCLSGRPEIRDAYYDYRASGANGQNGKDFALQLSAIRTFNGSNAYTKIRQAKTLVQVIAGEEDELFPISHSIAIADLLNKAVQIIPKVGHMIHLEAPDILAQVIREFLSQ